MGKQFKEYYVNGYERTERYGGPQEGGWWYSVYRFVHTNLVTPNEQAARSWSWYLHDMLEDMKGERWHVPMIPDNDDGDYDHMVSVSYMPLVYRVETHPGEDYDTHPGEWY